MQLFSVGSASIGNMIAGAISLPPKADESNIPPRKVAKRTVMSSTTDKVHDSAGISYVTSSELLSHMEVFEKLNEDSNILHNVGFGFSASCQT